MSILIPLLSLENKKLDKKLLQRCLLNEYGQATTIAENLQFFSWGVYRDRPKNSVYALSSEIDFITEKKEHKNGGYENIYSCVVVGQSGAFLLADESLTYTEISNTINVLKPFIELCKLCEFDPFAVAHISDGDSYLSHLEYERHGWQFECEVLSGEGGAE